VAAIAPAWAQSVPPPTTIGPAPTPNAPGPLPPAPPLGDWPGASDGTPPAPPPGDPGAGPETVPLSTGPGPAEIAIEALIEGFQQNLGWWVVFSVYLGVVGMQLARKTNTPHAWLAWVPVGQLFLLSRIARRPAWWVFLLFVPYVNLLFLGLLWMGIATAVGRPSWVGLLTMVPLIGLIIPLYLAFGGGATSGSARVPPVRSLPPDPEPPPETGRTGLGLCPTCRTLNRPGASACIACGTPMGPAEASRPAHVLPTGTRLRGGEYSIGKVLGQGGFGITYLGADARRRRAVAIKEFFPHGCARDSLIVQPLGAMSADDYQSALRRFLEEACTLAQFQHPSIVRVYAAFEENNTAYMPMEYLKGKTLLKLVEERRRLPEAEAVDYIEHVGAALAAVHAKGLLHRDIKPENLIVTEDGRVVLIDFGSARTFAAGKTRRMTQLLTPGYAPLEQYGQAARFGAFTDVYALGATLYHLLTGEVPVQAVDRAAGVELPAPRALNPGVSVTVDEAVMAALAMRVDARPQSVTEFLASLRGRVPPKPRR
jgi:predicted Ser/Thr protein kinase